MNLEEHENYDCHETVDVDDRADANLHIARFYCIMPGTCTVAHPCAVVASHLKRHQTLAVVPAFADPGRLVCTHRLLTCPALSKFFRFGGPWLYATMPNMV
jgi:hypothetical protein